MVDEIRKICTKKHMEIFMKSFMPQALNDRNNRKNDTIIEDAIKKCKEITDETSLVKLYYLKVARMKNLTENMQDIINLSHQMRDLSKEINYDGGLALAYNVEWYVEKYRGNIEESKSALNLSIKHASQDNVEKFAYHICFYSYAVEQWLEKRDKNSSIILEDCANFFYSNRYFQSFAKTLCVLVIIYQQTQNKEKSQKLVKKILSDYGLLSKTNEEIQSIIHFFIGVGHKLCFNINNAENHFQESQKILKLIYKKSIYSGYYLRCLTHLTACYALQGKLEQALKQMKGVEELIEEGIATKNLDSFNKRQTKHDFSLTKFYIYSRLRNFKIEDLQKLVLIIMENIKEQHSDAIFLSEFLLNAELTQEQLREIKNLKNPSTKRVEHIIDFLIERKTLSEEKYIVNTISTLKRQPVEEQMTFVEKAFADLLAAREYHRIDRFAEIYPLLKKYENHLHRIEVLEIRVFMEAFIQVGAFKNGNPLGPALQYMAIKKCRYYGFSSLEIKLLNYLELQYKDMLSLSKR